MAKLRRSSLIVWLTGLLGLSLAGFLLFGKGQQPGGLSFDTTGAPGSLKVTNNAPRDINVMRTVGIEKKAGDEWVPIVADFYLVSKCTQPPNSSKCTRLAAHETFTVVRWTGFSCSGQCNRTCRANVAYGPGTYRFAITTCADNQRHYTQPFVLLRLR